MEITVEMYKGVAIASPMVETIDANNVLDFRDEMLPVLQGNKNVVLDMSPVGFMDSSGLGAILSCLRKLNETEGNLALCGISESVRALIELVRLQVIVDILGSKEEAAESLLARR